ncbi:hypothetical protein POTOM_038227 [Populus tomentosa]|uniref:Uncharacterized protein n=1 Tax=Populus tomentosa TaxID=118781 RepID=A0A8X7YVK5_POPTO|nr:hypothetical protein POTOM_038227 [Populus tomentosa]
MTSRLKSRGTLPKQVILQVPELNSYVVALPLIEGNFRSAIQPGNEEEVILCVERGSTKAKGKSLNSCAYLHFGDNLMISRGMSFLPYMFIWGLLGSWKRTLVYCMVVQSLAENEFPPIFFIIDDGWQRTNMDHESPSKDSKDLTGPGSQVLYRLCRFEENEKFTKNQADKGKLKLEGLMFQASPSQTNQAFEEEGLDGGGLKALASDLLSKFPGLDDVYVWHALDGKTMPDLAADMIITDGFGLVNPDQAGDFYEAMHSYLVDVGITGVKVDVIHVSVVYPCQFCFLWLTLAPMLTDLRLRIAIYSGVCYQVLDTEDRGGVIQLAKAHCDGLNQSPNKNFEWVDPNGDPMGVYWLQGVHMIHLWRGQFIQPDWDTFQSDHLCAESHAGSRVICGGLVYVTDKDGHRNFDLLKLVLPDGNIFGCQNNALPTRDRLFENPLVGGKNLLKIWNLNKVI